LREKWEWEVRIKREAMPFSLISLVPLFFLIHSQSFLLPLEALRKEIEG